MLSCQFALLTPWAEAATAALAVNVADRGISD